MVAAFKRKKGGRRGGGKLDSSTLRGFGGGWNAIDDDLSMQPNFQVELVNFNRATSGAQAVRFGSYFNTDISDVHNSPIVDGFFFNNWNVVFCQDGFILMVSGDGLTKTIIWNGFPAGTVVDGPTIKQVSWVPFKSSLLVHTGQTKPLEIKSDMTCNYLGDPIGGNVNTPIGRFGCVASNFHCVASIVETTLDPPVTGVLVVKARKPTEIYITSEGTSGTFPGDPDPNNATTIDVGAYAPEGAASIRGIAGFRTYLLVFLQNITLQVKLGVYDDSTPPKHKPAFPDTLPQFGVLGNRTVTTVENDIMFCGLSGLASAKRNLYAPDSISSDFLSTQVSPAYRRIVGALTDDDQQRVAFAAHDRLNYNFLLFMPEGKVLCYTFNPRLKMHAWSEFENMNWTSAWTSILGRLFLTTGTRIFQNGNGTFAGENYYADRIMDRDIIFNTASSTAFVDQLLYYDGVANEVWRCTGSHAKAAGLTFDQERTNNPTLWTQYAGNPIPIRFELPWIDGKDPAKLKQLRYISIATKGDAEFTFEVYVDNLYKDVEGNVVYEPGATMTFIGNDAYGFGYDDDPYGMGRRSRDPRLYALPIKFKSIKFRVIGNVAKKFELINLTFLYARNKLQGYVR